MAIEQLSLFKEVSFENKIIKGMYTELFPLNEYDHIIISESGGKDSMACLFELLNLGVERSKLELWHQCVDGNFQDHTEFLDWPVTEKYIEAVGKHFGINVSYQWREKGIYGELLRKDSLTGDVYYCDNDGEIIHLPTSRGKNSTRFRWPALSSDLRIRWCSAVTKIDVFRRVLNNHPKYKGTLEQPKKILVVTGERREESVNRSRYLESEIHACNSQKRIVHAWRTVIDWNEAKVWGEYEKRSFLPHPAYLLGWNRTSCFGCIFSTADLWAMMREIAPERFDTLVRMENEINHTIDPRNITLEQKANMGSIKRLPKDKRLNQWVNLALNRSFNVDDLIMNKWELPAGAFNGTTGGPC
jgi:3'-phosphoadenosine 5'-phosphosulfate sulfotransferase (PAPS reductase)/FAD synthetase